MTPGWICWLRDNEERDDGVRYVAMDFREAAEEHARKRWDLDSGMEIDVIVEAPDGGRRIVVVEVVPVPSFHAKTYREAA